MFVRGAAVMLAATVAAGLARPSGAGAASPSAGEPAEILLRGRLHWRGALIAPTAREMAPGTTAGGGKALAPSCDASVELRAMNGRIRVRNRSGAWVGCGSFPLPGGGRLLAGRVEARWGVGCLLADLDACELSNATGAAEVPPGEIPLKARATTAWSDRSQGGAVAHLPIGPVQVAAWGLKWDQGLGVALGPWAAAVIGVGTRDKRWWDWSCVLSWRPTAPTRARKASDGVGQRGDWLIFELSGPLTPQSSDLQPGLVSAHLGAIGGHWSLGLAPIFGALGGAFRYRGLNGMSGREESRHFEIDEGWTLRWALPALRGVAPLLSLSSQKTLCRRVPVPVVEKSARLTLAAEPWSGAWVRVIFTGARSLRCRSDPSNPDRKVLARLTRSTLDLQARIQVSPSVVWTLRYRQAGGDLTVSDAETPLGIAPLLDANASEDAIEGQTSADRRWERRMGGIIWARLRWRACKAWQGGVTLAASPADGGGASAVPVRLPPGRSFWRSIGAGRWFIDLWAGCGGSTWRVEGAVRLLAGGGADPVWGEILLGMRRRIELW